MKFTLTVTAKEDEDTRRALLEPLRAFNESKAGPSHYLPLIVELRDELGVVRGGIWGYTAYGWLFVQFLVVPEQARGSGLGTQLMAAAESEALIRGCHDAWLDTHEFQAKGFYEKLGYASFGHLPGYPPPFSRYFFKKRLRPTTAGAA